MALYVTARHEDTYQDNANPPAGVVYVFDCLLIGDQGEIAPVQHTCEVSVYGSDSPTVLRQKIAAGLRANFAAEGITIPSGNITFLDYVKG